MVGEAEHPGCGGPQKAAATNSSNQFQGPRARRGRRAEGAPASADHDRHRRQGHQSLASANRRALGRSVQFLSQRRTMGPHVRANVPVPSILGAGLFNQHHWLANRMREEGIDFHQCSNAFMRCARPERVQELADALPARPDRLRPEVARLFRAVLHPARAVRPVAGMGLAVSRLLAAKTPNIEAERTRDAAARWRTASPPSRRRKQWARPVRRFIDGRRSLSPDRDSPGASGSPNGRRPSSRRSKPSAPTTRCGASGRSRRSSNARAGGQRLQGRAHPAAADGARRHRSRADPAAQAGRPPLAP